MADFSKITNSVGGTTYDVKDATARSDINNIINKTTKLAYGDELSLTGDTLSLLDPNNNVLSSVTLGESNYVLDTVSVKPYVTLQGAKISNFDSLTFTIYDGNLNSNSVTIDATQIIDINTRVQVSITNPTMIAIGGTFSSDAYVELPGGTLHKIVDNGVLVGSITGIPLTNCNAVRNADNDLIPINVTPRIYEDQGVLKFGVHWFSSQYTWGYLKPIDDYLDAIITEEDNKFIWFRKV